MTAMPTPESIESRASACGLGIPEMCRRAGTGNSAFYRWRAGKDIKASTLTRWLDVLAREETAAKKPAA